MSVTRRQLWTAAVIGAVAVVVVSAVATPVFGALFSGLIPTSGTIPHTTNTDTTVFVSGASDMAGTDYPFDNTVFISADNHNMTVIGNGQANASVAAGDIEGGWTRVSGLNVAGTTVIFDPSDKAQIAVTGDATAVKWRDYAVDDGTTDVVISGPDGTNSQLTLYELPTDLTISAVNASTGTTLDVSTTNSNGRVTFDIGHSEQSILLQSGDQSATPELSNPSPTGDLSTPPTELSIDVADADFPDDTVDVTIDYDGSQIHSESITSNGTITATLPSTPDGGVHSWTVNATDSQANSEIKSYSFTTPSDVYIYNETKNATGQHELLDNANITIEATLSGTEDFAETRTVTNGVFDLEGLDASRSYVLTLQSDDYYTRSVYLPNLYEQRAIFLLNKSQPSTDNTIRLDDSTGQFADNPALQIQRVVNASNLTNVSQTGEQWYTIAGDRMGADNQYAGNFQQDARYRFKITNQQGDTRLLGEYVARNSELVTLEIGEVTFSGEVTEGVAFQASASRKVVDESTGATARFLKMAAATGDINATTLNYRVTRVDNKSTVVEDSVSIGDGVTVVTHNLTFLDPTAPSDQAYKVEWEIVKANGEIIDNTEYVGTMAPLGFGIDPGILSLMGWVGMIAFAGFTALRSPKMSVTGTPIMAAGLTMFGIVNIPGVLIVIAGAIGVFYLVGESRGR